MSAYTDSQGEKMKVICKWALTPTGKIRQVCRHCGHEVPHEPKADCHTVVAFCGACHPEKAVCVYVNK